MNPYLSLTIASRLESASLVGVSVRALARFVDFSEVEAYRIELCVVEAVTNAIQHAYGADPNGVVEVLVCLHKDALQLDVSDHGRPMGQERLLVQESDVADEPGILVETGRGIALMRQIMDEIRYESTESSNTLTLVRKHPPNLVS